MKSIKKMMMSGYIFVVCLMMIAAPVAVCANDDGGLAATVPAPRMPLIESVEDLAALTHLEDYEMELGETILQRNMVTSQGWAILGNDPELQMLWLILGNELGALCYAYDDMQAIPFGPMNLISLYISKRSGSDYMWPFFKGVTVAQIAAYEMPEYYERKLNFILFPNWRGWSDEERLTLKFTKALVENRLSDELYQEALEAWGEKRLLRNTTWVGYINLWSLVAKVSDLTYDPVAEPAPSIPPAAIENLGAVMEATRMRLLDYFYSLGN
ncbi:MAG: hypothetical protein HKP58_10035 [Desulfatitalea sp.]|nr:hypothetical protein [Desulfatitalea sp.]NNK00740.1 hypothetical protein [Desulfatitalea sp.]